MATGQIERVGKKNRTILKTLRQRKLTFEAAGIRPTRDAALDPLLNQLQRLRLRLDFQMRKLALEPPLGPAEDRALAATRDILVDAAEMVDLLIWFGAEIPEDGCAGLDAQFGAIA